MSIPDTADIVVIGSGPSGSTAAGILAKNGFDVVILDKVPHPRTRVGENIIPDFWRFADMLGATDDIVAANFVQKSGGRVSWANDVSLMTFADFGYTRPGLHVDRQEFDHILVKAAQQNGAEFFEQVTAHKVDFSDARQILHYNHASKSGSIAAQYIIDASGQAGFLARQFKTRITNPDFRFRSVWGYFENSKYYDFQGIMREHSQIREHLPVTYQHSLSIDNHFGWCWHIPMREATSIGFVLTKETVSRLKREFASWDERFTHVVETEPALAALMEKAKLREDGYYFINDFAGHSEDVAGSGYFIIGDAAGFFDPIFSIGVALGMFGGSLAAWATSECLKKPHHAQRYQTMFTKQLVSRLEIARGLALPHYASAPLDEERAGNAMRFTRDDQLALVRHASSMSKRGHNLSRLLD